MCVKKKLAALEVEKCP